MKKYFSDLFNSFTLESFFCKPSKINFPTIDIKEEQYSPLLIRKPNTNFSYDLYKLSSSSLLNIFQTKSIKVKYTFDFFTSLGIFKVINDKLTQKYGMPELLFVNENINGSFSVYLKDKTLVGYIKFKYDKLFIDSISFLIIKNDFISFLMRKILSTKYICPFLDYNLKSTSIIFDSNLDIKLESTKFSSFYFDIVFDIPNNTFMVNDRLNREFYLLEYPFESLNLYFYIMEKKLFKSDILKEIIPEYAGLSHKFKNPTEIEKLHNLIECYCI